MAYMTEMHKSYESLACRARACDAVQRVLVPTATEV